MPSDHSVPAPPPAEANPSAATGQLAAALLDQAYTQLPVAVAASLGLSLLVAIVLRATISTPVLLTWLLTVWLFSGLRLLLYHLHRQAPAPVATTKWRNLFAVSLQANGLAWGCAGFLLFAEGAPAYQVFLAFVLGGMVAGVTTSLAALQIQLRVFILLLLWPISLKFYLAGDSLGPAMGLMLLLYGGFSALMSAKIYQIIRSALILRLKNREEMAARRKAEESLNLYQNNLERLVFERTRALSKSNEELFQEILERKKAEEEKNRLVGHLLHTQKMEAIGTLAGGIAHDFNNILSIILGFTELALDELPENARLTSDLRQVFTAAQRGKNLVQQILQFSRNDRQNPQAINPRDLIDELLKMLRATIPATVEIKSDLEQDCGLILADPNQLHRVLTNLANNAAHAMADKGVLTFSLKQVQLDRDTLAPQPDLRPGPYAKISVQDSGCGIAPELLKRIFEPFFTTKAVDKGTGMGLAVVHGIVSSNQGLITVDSKLGQGSTFHLFFPITTQPSTPAPQPDPAPPRGREKILVVDDEEAIAVMTSRLLTAQGYQVTPCGGGAEALAQFRVAPESFALVITDQSMPGMTGLELTAELLKLRADLPIILCTGYSTKINEKTIAQTGIKEILMKPISRQELASRVRVVLDEAREKTPG